MNAEHHKTFFNKLIQQPGVLSNTDQVEVNSLSAAFPYCQILVFAKNKLEQNPELASVYAPQRPVLQKFMLAPETLENLSITATTEAEILEKVLVKDADESRMEDAVHAELNLRENHEAEDTAADETEQLILESIASADFFALEEKVTEQPQEEKTSQEISRYDDDQMPYTFLWWLNKTRNEHADTYQPYVSFKLDTSQEIKKESGESLNQEVNIPDFDLSDLNKTTKKKTTKAAKQNSTKTKADEIIERFINEEPQISPPSAEKMGGDNKARKSSEDSLDLVSETLAEIYTEQMLWDKAIETYRKLSLKFPEKSPYFADQISALETRKN